MSTITLRIASALVLAASLALPEVVRAQGKPSSGSDEAAIRGALERWVKLTNVGDRKGASSIWAPDLAGWYPGQPDDTYQREMDGAARPRPANAPRVNTELTINEVLVSGPLAVVRDTWTFTRFAAETTRQTIRSFEVWRKQKDGAWKIARWISAPEAPTPAPKG